MAKILLGGLAQDVRGSLNGSTFSRNKGGAYVRTKVSGVQPRTPAQQAVRENLSQGSKNYSGVLTDAQRAAWAGFATANTRTNVFGNTVHLSALQWYVGLNQVLVQIGSPRIVTPPTDLSVGSNLPAVGIISNSNVTPFFEIDSDPGTVDANTAYYVFATAPQSPGKVPQSSLYRFIATATLTSSTLGTTTDLSAEYQAKWGTPILDKKIFAIISNVNTLTGATTVGQKFSTIVTTG